MRRCPTCHGQVPPRDENRAYPFCSERCRLIDLGRWLGEEYRIPGEEAPADDEPARGGDEGSPRRDEGG